MINLKKLLSKKPTRGKRTRKGSRGNLGRMISEEIVLKSDQSTTEKPEDILSRTKNFIAMIFGKVTEGWHRWLIITTIMIVMVALGTCLGFFIAIQLSRLTLLEVLFTLMPRSYLGGANILVLGIDEAGGDRRTDTIMICHINPDGRRVGVLSIPRDTKVNISGIGITKINHAYAYGGINLVREAVSGFLEVPIQYTFKINILGLEKFIDSLGGIVVDVDRRMYYVDRAGGLYIDLKAGRQHLNGKQALGFVRFRHDNDGDIGRISRQQQFVKAIGDKMIKTNLLMRIPDLVDDIDKYIETNMSTQEIVSFALQMSKAYREGLIELTTVPGAGMLEQGVSYWRPDMLATKRLIETVLMGFEKTELEKAELYGWRQIKPKKDGVFTKEVPLITRETLPRMAVDWNEYIPQLAVPPFGQAFPNNFRPAIAIFNGNGQGGSAGKARDILRDKGLTISRVGDAAHYRYLETQILCGLNEEEKIQALYLARYLGLELNNIVVQEGNAELAIVLGSDWKMVFDKVAEKNK